MLTHTSENVFRPMGSKGSLMINTLNNTDRTNVQHGQRDSAKRDSRRGGAPADHLMYAWSISATRPAQAERINVVNETPSDCPPEVFIG